MDKPGRCWSWQTCLVEWEGGKFAVFRIEKKDLKSKGKVKGRYLTCIPSTITTTDGGFFLESDSGQAGSVKSVREWCPSDKQNIISHTHTQDIGASMARCHGLQAMEGRGHGVGRLGKERGSEGGVSHSQRVRRGGSGNYREKRQVRG